MQQKYYLVLCSILFFVTIIIVSFFLIYPVINSDSGFYLSVAKEVYNGKIYFKEIATNYNPLAILLIGSPFLFSNNPDIRINLIINLFFILGSTFIFFKIISKILNSKTEILFYSLFFLLGTINLESKGIILEPISVFFQISSFYLYIEFRRNLNLLYLFFSAIFVSLSFLSKQYGLFILAPILIDLLVNHEKIFKKILLFSIGVLVPIFIFYVYLSIQEVTLNQFIKHIFGVGTKLDLGSGTGLYYNLSIFAICFAVFTLANSYLLIVPFLILKINKNNFKSSLIFILPLFFSLLVLVKASFYHYFQYIIPYTLIAFVYLDFNFCSKSIKLFKNILFGISICFIIYTNLKNLYKFEENYKNQIETAFKINSFIPRNKKVFLHGISQEYYILCNFNSINSGNIGYGFPEYFFIKTIVNNTQKDSYIIVSDNLFENYSSFINQFTSREIVLNKKKYFILKKK